MPLEISEEDALARIPDLRVAQKKFLLQTIEPKNADLKKSLLKDIEEKEMAPFYAVACKELGWRADAALEKRLAAKNETKLKELQEKLENAEKNEGESEIREALQAKAEYLAQIGDKDAAIEATKKTMEKTVGIGNRMDLVFNNIRIGLFYTDHKLVEANVATAKQMLEEGGDWDRRNRLKVYEGLYALSVRNFAKAANLFLETVSTFTSYELMSYVELVTYTVVVGMIALDRSQLLEKVVQGSEILEVLHDLPVVRSYLMSLYECHYGDFFSNLAAIEQLCKRDRYLFPHFAFYVREMKVGICSKSL